MKVYTFFVNFFKELAIKIAILIIIIMLIAVVELLPPIFDLKIWSLTLRNIIQLFLLYIMIEMVTAAKNKFLTTKIKGLIQNYPSGF